MPAHKNSRSLKQADALPAVLQPSLGSTLPKSLQCWRPLAIGQRVALKTAWRRGQQGVVIRKWDDSITGMARYSIRLDSDPDRQTDVVRSELSVVKNKVTRSPEWHVPPAGNS